MPAPLVRARNLHHWLVLIGAEPEPWRSKFREALPREVFAAIEEAGRFEWLPAQLHVQMSDALLEAFGPQRAHDYYRRAMSASVRGPVLGPLFRTGSKLLGLKVPTFLRWASHGWSASFKDTGTLAGEVLAPGHGRLIYAGLPSFCTASKAWVESAQGSAYGVLDMVQSKGVVRLDTSNLARGGFQLELEWSDAGA